MLPGRGTIGCGGIGGGRGGEATRNSSVSISLSISTSSSRRGRDDPISVAAVAAPFPPPTPSAAAANDDDDDHSPPPTSPLPQSSETPRSSPVRSVSTDGAAKDDVNAVSRAMASSTKVPARDVAVVVAAVVVVVVVVIHSPSAETASRRGHRSVKSRLLEEASSRVPTLPRCLAYSDAATKAPHTTNPTSVNHPRERRCRPDGAAGIE